MKVGFWALIGILGIVVLVVAVWGIRYITAPIEGKVGAYEQIQSKEVRLAAYNHFFDLYAAIQSYDGQLKALNEQLVQVKSSDEQERVLATIAGVKGMKARAIAQYNVDANKSYTIGQFRDWQLPYQIDSK